MNGQTSSYPNTGNNLIGEELDKLFAFQDKHLSKEKRSILLDALATSGIPDAAIILGIRKLMNDDLPSIKMGTIFAAARAFVEGENYQKCDDCSEGYVVLRDEVGQWFSMACQCGQGSLRHTAGLAHWKGEEHQLSNGRPLHKLEPMELGRV